MILVAVGVVFLFLVIILYRSCEKEVSKAYYLNGGCL